MPESLPDALTFGNASNLPPEGHNTLRTIGGKLDEVIAWWKIPEDVQCQIYKKETCALHMLFFGWPIMWLALPITAPIMAGKHCHVKSGLESHLVILTRRKIVKQQEFEMCCCYSSGLDVQSYALKDILSVTSDRKGSGCFPYAQTKVMLPGLIQSPHRKYEMKQNRIKIPCDEIYVDRITRMVSEAKDASETMAIGVPYGTPAAPVGAGPGFSGELERLTALWKQGALSDAEFQRAKNRIMSGPM